LKKRGKENGTFTTYRNFLGTLRNRGGMDSNQTTYRKEIEMDIKKLQNEYTDWLVENLPREYVENQDCSAEAILFESLEGGQITLNDDQKEWLNDFCTRWNKMLNE